MNPYELFPSNVASALGWTLLHAIWQGFAIVLPTALALHLLRKRPAQGRYALGISALAAQVVASAVTFAYCYVPAANVAAATTLPNARPAATLLNYAPATLPWFLKLQLFLSAHLDQIVAGWAVGVALLLLRMAGGYWWVQRLRHTARPLESVRIDESLARLRETLRINGAVRVLESARVLTPVVVGALKPVVLLPVGLVTGLSPKELEAVLAHELAHVRRHDYVVNLLQSVVEISFFFHPALWWLSARVREERELCCDDLAVQACGSAPALARALARVQELTAPAAAPALAMAFASRKQQLLYRVRRMLGVPTRSSVSNTHLAGLTLATLLLFSVSVYAAQRPDEPKPLRSVSLNLNQAGRITSIYADGKKLSEREAGRIMTLCGKLENGEIRMADVANPTDRQLLKAIQEARQTNMKGRSGSVQVGPSEDDVLDGDVVESALRELESVDLKQITADALREVENLDLAQISADAMKEVQALDMKQITADALREVDGVDMKQLTAESLRELQALRSLNRDSLERLRGVQRLKMDSIRRNMSQLREQIETLRLKQEGLRFQTEELERKAEVLNWRKEKLNDQRQALLEKQRNAMYQDGNDKKQPKLTEADVEKLMAETEPKVKALEQNISEVNRELETLRSQMAKAQQPIDQIEEDIRQIEFRSNQLVGQYSQEGERYARAHSFEAVTIPASAEIRRMEREAQKMQRDAQKAQREARQQYNQAMERQQQATGQFDAYNPFDPLDDKSIHGSGTIRSTRPARAPRPSRPARPNVVIQGKIAPPPPPPLPPARALSPKAPR